MNNTSTVQRASRSGRPSLFHRDLLTPSPLSRIASHKNAFGTPAKTVAATALLRENSLGGGGTDTPPPPNFTLDERFDSSPEIFTSWDYTMASPESRSSLQPGASMSLMGTNGSGPFTPNKSYCSNTLRSGLGNAPMETTNTTQAVMPAYALGASFQGAHQNHASGISSSNWWSPVNDNNGKGGERGGRVFNMSGVVQQQQQQQQQSGGLLMLPSSGEIARPDIQRDGGFSDRAADEEEWVTVFGFSPSDTNLVLREFEKCGILLNHVPGPGDANWMHILYQVAETRFASHTLVLRRLVKVREALSSMVINHLWSVWRQSNSEKAAKVKGLILDDGWWDRVDYLLSFTEPILSMLRFVDMDNPCMGEVYDGIDSMIETIKSIINAKEQDPSEKFFKEVHSILVERWNKMTTPLHLLAFALNPKYYSAEILSLPRRVLPYRDIEVSEGYKAAFSRLFPDPEEEDMVMGEFGLFMTSTGHSLGAMRDKYKKDAHMWWCLHGQAYTQLQPLAIKILSQVASSSSAERNWGTYTFIHSVKRNKLAAKKAEDLVYVHSNLRLLTHKLDEYKHGSTMFWDNDPETPDLDASIAHIALHDTDVACSSHDLHSGASGSGTAMSAAACDSNELHDDDNENIEEEYDYNEEEE